jgi:threonine dehydrogenase-like Zn-dependent dehydrogenase
MTEVLRAAQVTAPGTIELVPLEDPGLPGPGQVAVELIACGICGSNLHHLNRPDLIGADRRDKPGALGHEMSGRVLAVGPDVETHAVGDLVALEPQLAAACGHCDGCATGSSWFCTDPRTLAVWGFADRLVVRAAGAWRLPAGMDPLVATLMEATAVSVHALRVTHLCRQHGDDLSGVRVVVLGAGATGLLAVAAARHLGATDVVCVARHPHQATLAQRMGASEVLREDDADLEATLTAGRPDLVVECVGGRATTFDLAARIVGPRGEISVLGLFDEPQQVDGRSLFRREARVVFPVVYGELDGRHDYDIAADILATPGLPVDEIITHRFPLADVRGAFATAGSKGSGVVRVVVGRTEADLT